MTSHKYNVGDEVFVAYDPRVCRSMNVASIVTSVGRKWATIYGGERFEIATGYIDGNGYISRGRVWASHAEYEAHVNREAAWQELRDFVYRRYSPPLHLSADRIREILKELSEV